jgi:hypothetical protein
MHKLWYVSHWLLPDWQLDGISNRPEGSLDARFCAGMDPEYPCVGLLRSDSVGEFDGQL